jgi:hypothetical protein
MRRLSAKCLPPRNPGPAVQTTLIPSGGAVAVETKFVVPGDYLIVDHSIFRLHKGAFATVHVEGAENKSVFEPKGYSEGIREGIQ